MDADGFLGMLNVGPVKFTAMQSI